MAGSPQLKVFSPDGEYIASCKYAEDAINMAQFRGNGAEVRHGHSKQMVVWRVSGEDDLTGDGEDIIDAELLWQRVDEMERVGIPTNTHRASGSEADHAETD